MLVNIFGKRGAGKTHMIKYAVHQCKPPVIVIDILGNFSDIPNSYETDSLSDALQNIEDYTVYRDASSDERRFMDKKAPITILMPDDPDQAIDYVCSMLYEVGGGTLVIDEADAFDRWNTPIFDKTIRYGRNWSIHILTGCRRPAELNRGITAGANCLYIFQTQEPRDIDYYAKTIIGKEHAERLKTLPDYHGIYINYDTKKRGYFKTDERGACLILSEENLNEGNKAFSI